MLLHAIDLDRFAPAAPTAEPVPAAAPSAALVARRFGFLTADGQSATPLEQEALLGRDDLVDASFLDRCLLARRCVGRIRIAGPGREGWATGFLIAPGLLLTNHHVFPTAESVANSRVGFDYWFDVAGQRPAAVDEYDVTDEFYVANAELDYAVVSVAQRSAGGASLDARRYLRLIPETGKVKQDDYVTLLQHPDGAPMQVALRDNQVVRAAPDEAYLWYRADTAHGSSGAPVLNDSLQVVALHASGRVKRDGDRYVLATGATASTLEGLGESEVVWEANVGFRVSRIAADLLERTRAAWPARVAALEAAMRGGDVMSSTIAALENRIAPTPPVPVGNPPVAGAAGAVIPIELRVTVTTQGAAVAVTAPVAGLEAEAFEARTPIIHDGLDERPGFNPKFLHDTPVPMPVVTPRGRRKLAPLRDGEGHELRYRHFSVWMQRERRLALFTAANVDWRARAKQVDGKPTTRAGLAGWPAKASYAERWVDDPRIDARHQLPDSFYTDDRGAFDKGHIVRRDDVCWGAHFDEIQMANGDTFHVTNCSPQTKAFNQGAAGDENWGDLEAMVASVTKDEAQAACLFAGPVFGADDRWFHGVDDTGAARVQIPRRYWKIVVARDDDRYVAYGFVLGQGVKDVTEPEFYVPEEWRAAWTPIKTIERSLRGWLSLDALAAIDAHADA